MIFSLSSSPKALEHLSLSPHESSFRKHSNPYQTDAVAVHASNESGWIVSTAETNKNKEVLSVSKARDASKRRAAGPERSRSLAGFMMSLLTRASS